MRDNDRLAGMPIYNSVYIERGQIVVAHDPAGGGIVVFEGTGLLRGVAYSTPGVTRGYVLEALSRGRYTLLDAATGWVVTVDGHSCVEVEARYRKPTIKEAVDA